MRETVDASSALVGNATRHLIQERPFGGPLPEIVPSEERTNPDSLNDGEIGDSLRAPPTPGISLTSFRESPRWGLRA
jgi:hypothetical protein